MLYSIKEEKDSSVIKNLKNLQFLFLVLLVIVLTGWILNIANVNLPPFVNSVINILISFGGIFYAETHNLFGFDVNFAYLSTILLFALILYAINIAIQTCKDLEKKRAIKEAEQKKIEADIVNNEIKAEYIKERMKYNNYVIAFDFKVTKNFSAWENSNEKDYTEKNATSDLFSLLEGNLDCESEFIEDNLVLKFSDFPNLDEKLNIITDLMKSLKNDYIKNKNCTLEWSAAVEVLKSQSEIERKAGLLQKLLTLKVPNKFVCLNSFKTRYELQNNSEYAIQCIGVYQLYDNEDVFTVEKIKG